MRTAFSSPESVARPNPRTHAGHDLALHEAIIWQGRPSWLGTARHILYGDWIFGYFVVVLVIGVISAVRGGHSLLSVVGVLPPALLVSAIVGGLAFFIARSTHYIVTSHRIIIRFGAAIPRSVAIPFGRIASLSVAVRGNGRGDIVLKPKTSQALRYLKLWPHARPFRIAAPEPMLRDVADAGLVATRLARMLNQTYHERQDVEEQKASARAIS